MPEFLGPIDQYALSSTVGSYSSGTRVYLQNFTKQNTAFVSVVATKEVLEVSKDDIVKLRDRFRIVKIGRQEFEEIKASQVPQ